MKGNYLVASSEVPGNLSGVSNETQTLEPKLVPSSNVPTVWTMEKDREAKRSTRGKSFFKKIHWHFAPLLPLSRYNEGSRLFLSPAPL